MSTLQKIAKDYLIRCILNKTNLFGSAKLDKYMELDKLSIEELEIYDIKKKEPKEVKKKNKPLNARVVTHFRM